MTTAAAEARNSLPEISCMVNFTGASKAPHVSRKKFLLWKWQVHTAWLRLMLRQLKLVAVIETWQWSTDDVGLALWKWGLLSLGWATSSYPFCSPKSLCSRLSTSVETNWRRHSSSVTCWTRGTCSLCCAISVIGYDDVVYGNHALACTKLIFFSTA